MINRPSHRQISIAFQTDKTPADYIALAQLVDHYDFDAVSVYGDAPFQPSYGPLLLMAPHLKRARIGAACISPSRMAALDIAGDTALLDHLTNGRAYIGIARGAWLERHGIAEVTPPIAAIRDTLAITKKLLAKDDSGYEGKRFSLAPGITLPYDVLRADVPVLIGTWGPQLAALAGEVADEVKIGGSANPDMIPVMQSWIADGERKTGRAVGSCGVVIGAVCVVDEDSRAAKTAVKRDLALYLPVVAGLDRTVQIDPVLMAAIDAKVNAGDRDGAAALIPDDLLAKFAFAGNPQELIDHAETLFAAGADRVEFGTPHGLKSQHGIELIGRVMIPAIRDGFR